MPCMTQLYSLLMHVCQEVKDNSVLGIHIYIYVTGPAKTGHIYTKYTCSENSTFLGLCS